MGVGYPGHGPGGLNDLSQGQTLHPNFECVWSNMNPTSVDQKREMSGQGKGASTHQPTRAVATSTVQPLV